MRWIKSKEWKTGVIETPLRVWEELGEIKKLIYDPIKDAEKAAAHKITQLRTEFKVRVLEPLKKELTKQSEERITTYAIGKQKNGMTVLEAMGKEIPELTSAEMKVYKFMREKLEEAYHFVNDARKQAGLKPFEYTENYFTFWRIMEEMAEEGVSMADRGAERRFAKSKETPFRFKKHRGDLGVEVRLDGYNVFDNYMDMAHKHAELTPHIAKGRELLMKLDDGTRRGFKLSDTRKNAHAFISTWLDTAAGMPRTETVQGIKKAGSWISENLTAAVLAYNVRSALIQVSAITPTFSELGTKYTLKGIESLFDDAKIERAEKYSNIITRQFDVHITDLMRKTTKLKKKVAQKGMAPLQWLDKKTATATWNGSYDFAIEKKGMKHKEAVRFADDMVTRTQASALATDLSPIQRSQLGKLGTLFQTFVINHFEYIAKDLFGMGKEGVSKAKVAKKVGRYVVGITLFNIFYEDVLGVNSPFPTPLRSMAEALAEGDDPITATAKGAKDLLDLVPIFSSLRYGSSLGGPIVELGQDIGDIISESPGPKRKPISVAGRVLGVPGTAQIEKTAKRLGWGQNVVSAILGSGKGPEQSKLFEREGHEGRTGRKGRKGR